jgi:lipopolysaccharide heptosyltransferase II
MSDHPLLTYYSPRPALEPEDIKKILVVKLDHLGDVILSLTAIRRLRQLFPNSEITALVGNWAKSLVEDDSSVDRVLTYDFFRADSSVPPKPLTEKEKQRISAWLAGYGFDLAVDLRRHTETRQVLALSHARYTAGFATEDEYPWLTFSLPYAADRRMSHPRRHVSEELAVLVELLGAGRSANIRPAIKLSPDHHDHTEELLRSLAPSARRLIVGMHPGVGQPIRRWPIEYFARLADMFVSQYGATILVFGTNNEKSFAEGIVRHMEFKNQAMSLAGRLTLPDFVSMLQRCDLFVGNNSGPGHIAASLEIPTLGIYAGTNDSKEWGPLGANAIAVYLDMACSPCYLVDPGDCPYGVACMRRLYPERVWQVVPRLIAGKQTKGDNK